MEAGRRRLIRQSCRLTAAAQSARGATATSPQLLHANFCCKRLPRRPSAPTGQPQTQPANAVIMLPPGTKLPLGLLRPLRVKPGQDVYLQITFPVTVGQPDADSSGRIRSGHSCSKSSRKTAGHCNLPSVSANLIFFNGYTVPISGTVTVGTTNAALVPPQPGSSGWSIRACHGRCGKCGSSTATAVATAIF